MPLVTVLTDVPAMIAAADEVAMTVHNAVKSELGKPDMYITVAVTEAKSVMVGGQKMSAVVEVDSIGGDFGKLIGKISREFEAYGVDPGKVTGTFRGVSHQEFAMNGKPLG
eukprot:TRINITY_DN19931_c0_g1_i1.p1 TRINITY_DN19931_c0_g1~~TRINITY_DN19931_c0_g1_i1.p1  ORF type:complete len:111 (-),score=34.64 TRINITY_DN19931_c0_g1_i1:272-604(-)